MRRVCKRCHDIIQTSKTVQKGLCVYTAQDLGAGPATKTSLGLVFHFRSIEAPGDLYFRLEMLYTRDMMSTFLLNFTQPPQDWAFSHLRPGDRLRRKVITIVEGSETGEELWRKIRWIEEGVKRGARVWLEKETSEFQSVSFSRRLSEGASLGGTFELLREMATTMMC